MSSSARRPSAEADERAVAERLRGSSLNDVGAEPWLAK
jgi:hypothetical protein